MGLTYGTVSRPDPAAPRVAIQTELPEPAFVADPKDSRETVTLAPVPQAEPPVVTAPPRVAQIAEPAGDPPPAPPPQTPRPDPPQQITLRTSDISADAFPALLQAARATPRTGFADRLEYIRILLGGMFLPEAAMAIEEAFEYRHLAQPAEMAMLELQAHAVSALGGMVRLSEGMPAAGGETSEPWASLGRLRNGSAVEAQSLAKAHSSLTDQSPVIASSAIRSLFDAAVKIPDLELAEVLWRHASQDPGLSGSAQFSLMSGRLDELRGDREAAFDHYAHAMSGHDIVAVQARLELIDLVMEHQEGGLDLLPQIQVVLRESVADWTSDAYSLQLRARYAGITEELGLVPEALRVMSRIILENPGTEEAGLAAARVPLLLMKLGRSVDSGAVNLGEYAALMRDLEAGLRDSSQWLVSRHDLARRLGKAGLHRAAAAEYRAMRNDLAAGSPSTPFLRDEIILGEALEMLYSGEVEKAKHALSEHLTSGSPSHLERQQQLLKFIDEAEAAGAPLRLFPDESSTDADLLAARAAMANGRLAEAARHYDRHLGNVGSLPREEQSKYILARSRSVSPEAADPDETKHADPQIAALQANGRSLARATDDASPLSLVKGKSILGQVDTGLAAARRVLGQEPDMHKE
ncbi:hypothetical protein [Paracoccus ravus]|uniref:hypothetical protein n=1 Tax=Paracoccus ravus TaxID=2447760 RepID=UPI00106E8F7A|nr:hypothetical protein [Paracoccus ravus]